MARRLLISSVVLLLILLLLVAGSALWLRGWWAGWLEEQGIEHLQWSGLQLDFAGVRPQRVALASLVLEQQSAGRRLHLAGHGLQVRIDWRGWQPVPEAVHVTELSLDVWHDDLPHELPGSYQPVGEAAPDIPTLAERLRWLPERLTVDQFHLTLPCRSGRCDLAGSAGLTRAEAVLPLSIRLTLDDPQHPVRVDAEVVGHWPQQVSLDARLSADNDPLMTLTSDWRPSSGQLSAPERVQWHGQLEAPGLPQADWLLARLADWFEVPANPLPDQPQAGTLALHWQLDWPAGLSEVPRWPLLWHPELRGEAGLQARLPQPWPVPGIATVQGDLALALTADGRWLAQAAQGQLRLTGLGSWVEAVPEPLRPAAINLSLTPAGLPPGPSRHPGMLPLRLSVTTEGAQPLAIESHLAVATRAPWALQLGTTRLRARLPAWQAGEWRLQDIRADLTLTGEAGMNDLRLTFAQGSAVTVGHLDPPRGGGLDNLWLDGLSWRPEGLTVTADYGDNGDGPAPGQMVAEGPLLVTARNLRHPVLRAQGWRLHGQGRVTSQQLTINGQLRPDAGGPLTLALQWPFAGALNLDLAGRWQGKAGSDALAGVLTDWPPLLSFDQGAMTAELTLRQPSADASMGLSGALAFDQLSGLYDRTAWSGLSGRIPVSLEGERLQARASGLTLAQVNPGIPAGPVVLSGSYEAGSGAPAAGELTLTQAQASVLGGELVIEPRSWSVAERPLTIPVEIRALELGRLLTAYPMEGLSGTGTLNGHLPVLLTREGVAIEGGRVTAVAPGGTLVFPSDRLRAIGQNNPALNLVAQAMENFRYSVLNSTIDYDESGTLQLGLTLEGANPAVQQGQSVRLNLNVEENIPDLMTSLQLSGKVNEAVTERVRQLLQERGRTAP